MLCSAGVQGTALALILSDVILFVLCYWGASLFFIS